MELSNMISFGGRRQWVALGILAAIFAACMALGLSVVYFIAISVFFIGYICRSFSAYFISEHNFSGGRIQAYLLPVGMAVVQTLICFGVVWLIVWSVRPYFAH